MKLHVGFVLRGVRYRRGSLCVGFVMRGVLYMRGSLCVAFVISSTLGYARRPKNERYEVRYQVTTVKHGGGNATRRAISSNKRNHELIRVSGNTFGANAASWRWRNDSCASMTMTRNTSLTRRQFR